MSSTRPTTWTSTTAGSSEQKQILLFLVFVSFLLLPGSKRDRGVEDSCAKHLTTEFYAVIMLLTFILIIISIPSPPHSFIPGLT